MAGTKSARVATNANTQPQQEKLRQSKKVASEVREKLRDSVCTPDNGYAGGPKGYTYVPGHCVKKRVPGTTAKSEGTKTAITPAQTKKEIKILKKAVDAYGEKSIEKMEDDEINLMVVAFEAMIKTANRRLHPDPVERLDWLLQKYERIMKFDVVLPRHTLFKLTLTHLLHTS
jgi:ribonuclease HII